MKEEWLKNFFVRDFCKKLLFASLVLTCLFSVSDQQKLFNESIQGDQIWQFFANWATFGGSFMIFWKDEVAQK